MTEASSTIDAEAMLAMPGLRPYWAHWFVEDPVLPGPETPAEIAHSWKTTLERSRCGLTGGEASHHAVLVDDERAFRRATDLLRLAGVPSPRDQACAAFVLSDVVLLAYPREEHVELLPLKLAEPADARRKLAALLATTPDPHHDLSLPRTNEAMDPQRRSAMEAVISAILASSGDPRMRTARVEVWHAVRTLHPGLSSAAHYNIGRGANHGTIVPRPRDRRLFRAVMDHFAPSGHEWVTGPKPDANRTSQHWLVPQLTFVSLEGRTDGSGPDASLRGKARLDLARWIVALDLDPRLSSLV